MGRLRMRSLAFPEQVDEQVEAAARDAGMSFDDWVLATVRRELSVDAGLDVTADPAPAGESFSADDGGADTFALSLLEGGPGDARI